MVASSATAGYEAGVEAAGGRSHRVTPRLARPGCPAGGASVVSKHMRSGSCSPGGAFDAKRIQIASPGRLQSGPSQRADVIVETKPALAVSIADALPRSTAGSEWSRLTRLGPNPGRVHRQAASSFFNVARDVYAVDERTHTTNVCGGTERTVAGPVSIAPGVPARRDVGRRF